MIAPIPILLLLLVLHQSSTASPALPPIVIVPGLASSQLDSKIVNGASYWPCTRNHPKPYRIWFTVKESVTGVLCLVENTRLVYDLSTNCTIQGRAGTTITPHDWGGTDGIEALNPGGPKGFIFSLFADMVNVLVEKHGYVRGVSIRGAPNDFRLWGDACYSRNFLIRLQSLIEDTVHQNNGRPARVVCHSMGCPAVHKMLVSMDAVWKKKYVAGLVALGSPFGGAPSAIYTLVTGKMAGLSIPIQRSVGTWSSIPALLPHDTSRLPMYKAKDVVLQTPQRNYTVSTMFQLVRDLSKTGFYYTNYPKANGGRARLPDGDKVYKYINEDIFQQSDKHPGVEVDLAYVNDAPTASQWIFTQPDLSDKGTAVHGFLGDGTVPVNSIEIPAKAWAAAGAERISLHPLSSQPVSAMKGMTSQHMGECWHPDSIALVVGLVTGDKQR